MVDRLRGILYKPFRGLHEAAVLLGVSALASQLLALVRDRIFAYQFGAGEVLDVYYASFKIPDFLFTTVASLVSMTILIPFFTKAISVGGDEGHARGKAFLDSVFSLFLIVIVVTSVLVYFLVPLLSSKFVPGFEGETLSTYILFSRILLLQVIFMGLSGLLATVTQTFKHFFIYALTPILYNAGIIVGALLFYPIWGNIGLIWGVILGAFLHFFVQVPGAVRTRYFPKFTLRIKWDLIKDVLLTTIPRTVTLGVHQVVIVVLTAMASLLALGSITVFNFAFNLQGVPLAIIGVSYSMAAFPTLAALFAGGKRDEFLAAMTSAARHIIFWSLPVTALFIVLRAQVVRTILGTGLFDWDATRLVAAALAIFAVSVVAQSLVLLFVRGYYAIGNTKKPLIFNVTSSVLIIIFAFVLERLYLGWEGFRDFFEFLLRVSDVPGTEVLMLPLAYTLGMVINVLLFWISYRKDFPGFADSLRLTRRYSFYAAVVMGFVSYLFLGVFDNVFDLQTLVGIFLQGLCSGLIGIFAGVLLLKILGSQELEDFYSAMSTRVWSKKPILPSPEETDGV